MDHTVVWLLTRALLAVPEPRPDSRLGSVSIFSKRRQRTRNSPLDAAPHCLGCGFYAVLSLSRLLPAELARTLFDHVKISSPRSKKRLPELISFNVTKQGESREANLARWCGLQQKLTFHLS